jgi:glycerol-3-phosphate dehydrogenase
MKTFSYLDRKDNLKKFSDGYFDLIIVGGGINGAGVARDASMRGMRVALVEAEDFASGTSSRSSKLVHGGIRYLENLEFHLVFEALSERQKLFNLAPHLVHPLRFMLPLYQDGRVGMFKMGLGMWLYDALSLFQAPELHEKLSFTESIVRMPMLKAKGLLGSYIYSDAYMDDDRLVQETLRSAASFGAACANYCRAVGVDLDKNNQVRGITVRDELANKEILIRGKHVVSTVGPWTDQLGERFFPGWKKILRPTKGVHLTFEKSRLPMSSAVVMAAEKRIVFGIPRHEMVIIGTTDTDYPGDPSEVSTTVDDVKYLLSVTESYFPGAKIRKEDIISSYAGVRPLVGDSADTAGKTSREHTIFTDSHGVTFVAGGKYTTYRLIAEHVVNHCLKKYAVEDRVRFHRSNTNTPINPLITEDSFSMAGELKKQIIESISLSAKELQWLMDRHGFEALKMINQHGNNFDYVELEALHAIHNTMCLNLRDFYVRRMPLFLAERDHGLARLASLGNVFKTVFSLSDGELNEQKTALQKYIERELAWKKVGF